MILIRKLWECLYFIFGEGSWSLRPYESLVLEAAINSLGKDKQDTIRNQMSCPFFIERTNKHINVFRFYKIPRSFIISSPDFKSSLIKVSTIADSKAYKANVIFYKGAIFSIETRKPGKFFYEKDISVTDVEIGSSNESAARSIDRLEHGNDDNSSA